MKCAGERQVAPVGEWCDDEAGAVAKVLVAVEELGVDGSYVEVVVEPVVPGIFMGEKLIMTLILNSNFMCISL